MRSITKSVFDESRSKTEEWINKVKDLSIQNKPDIFYRVKWRRLNKRDQIELD